MHYNFSFRNSRYNFWPIYEAIKEHYPIGIKRNEDGIYFDYPGILALEKRVVENIHQVSNYQERWQNKCEAWSAQLQHQIVGTTYGQGPSFSAYLELEKKHYEDRVLEKRLHFTVSLLGPFYTVFACDLTTMIEKEGGLAIGEIKKDRHYEQVHRNVISPYGEYSDVFEKVRQLLEQEFTNYRFVPYFINTAVIDGLYVRYRDEEINTVYHALFNEHFDFGSIIVGDPYKYGHEQWIIDDANLDDQWNVYPPL